MKKINVFLLLLILIAAGCDINRVTDGVSTTIDNIVAETDVETKEEQVTIDRVVDGDTIKVKMPNGNIETVRLLLVDTPETVHPQKPVQPFGEEASAFAKETLQEGETVTLEIGDPKTDKYDRLLGYIWVGKENFNQLLIEKGLARVAYIEEPNTKYLDEFKKAEQQAEQSESNIWSVDGYVESEFNSY